MVPVCRGPSKTARGRKIHTHTHSGQPCTFGLEEGKSPFCLPKRPVAPLTGYTHHSGSPLPQVAHLGILPQGGTTPPPLSLAGSGEAPPAWISCCPPEQPLGHLPEAERGGGNGLGLPPSPFKWGSAVHNHRPRRSLGPELSRVLRIFPLNLSSLFSLAWTFKILSELSGGNYGIIEDKATDLKKLHEQWKKKTM